MDRHPVDGFIVTIHAQAVAVWHRWAEGDRKPLHARHAARRLPVLPGDSDHRRGEGDARRRGPQRNVCRYRPDRAQIAVRATGQGDPLPRGLWRQSAGVQIFRWFVRSGLRPERRLSACLRLTDGSSGNFVSAFGISSAPSFSLAEPWAPRSQYRSHRPAGATSASSALCGGYWCLFYG